MSPKIQTVVRLEKNLLKVLKENAKADRRSLNNYIENLLYQAVGNIPNDKTKEAIEEARNTSNLERIENLDDFFDNL